MLSGNVNPVTDILTGSLLTNGFAHYELNTYDKSLIYLRFCDRNMHQKMKEKRKPTNRVNENHQVEYSKALGFFGAFVNT